MADNPSKSPQPQKIETAKAKTERHGAYARRNATQSARLKRAKLAYEQHLYNSDAGSLDRYNKSLAALADGANAVVDPVEMVEKIGVAFDIDADKNILDTLPDIAGEVTKEEVRRLGEIRERLEATLSLVDIVDEDTTMRAVEKKVRKGDAYVFANGMTLDFDRGLIGPDIRFCTERLPNPNIANGAKVSPERLRIFGELRDRLDRVKNYLTTPAQEQAYLRRYGDDIDIQRYIRGYSKNLEAVKNSSRMGALLVVGAIAALWTIKDIRKGTLSIGTLVLIGAAMFLSQSGSKNAFMAHKPFADLSRRIGKDGVEKLHSFVRKNPSAANHLIATLRKKSGKTGEGITLGNLSELTEPKKNNGKQLDKTKAVPEDIAKLFIGDKTLNASAGVIYDMKGVRDTEATGVMGALAKANESSATVVAQLQDLIK